MMMKKKMYYIGCYDCFLTDCLLTLVISIVGIALLSRSVKMRWWVSCTWRTVSLRLAVPMIPSSRVQQYEISLITPTPSYRPWWIQRKRPFCIPQYDFRADFVESALYTEDISDQGFYQEWLAWLLMEKIWQLLYVQCCTNTFTDDSCLPFLCDLSMFSWEVRVTRPYLLYYK